MMINLHAFYFNDTNSGIVAENATSMNYVFQQMLHFWGSFAVFMLFEIFYDALHEN